MLLENNDDDQPLSQRCLLIPTTLLQTTTSGSKTFSHFNDTKYPWVLKPQGWLSSITVCYFSLDLFF